MYNMAGAGEEIDMRLGLEEDYNCRLSFGSVPFLLSYLILFRGEWSETGKRCYQSPSNIFLFQVELESFPEKNSFANFSFLCDCEGHIEEPRIKAALEELGLHCKSLEIIGVYEASSFRQL